MNVIAFIEYLNKTNKTKNLQLDPSYYSRIETWRQWWQGNVPGVHNIRIRREDGDHTLMTKEEILAKIATMTGGRAAEEVVFNSITTGASNDIEQATKMARAMITRYGMTDDFDMVALETVNNAYLGGDASLACSERTAATVDDKVVEVVKQQHEKAKQMLIENRGKLDEIAKYLYEKETITGEEFMRILTAVPQLPTGAVEQ